MTDRDDRLLDTFLEDLGSVPVPADLARGVARRIRDDHPRRQTRLAGWLALAAAALVLLVLAGVGALVAAPRPSPVPPSPTASPSAFSSGAPSSPIPAVVSSGSAAPSLPAPSATPASPAVLGPAQYTLTLQPSGTRPMPVLILDDSLGISAQPAEARPDSPIDGDLMVVQGSAPNQLVVGWLGSACEQFAQIEIDRAATAITVGRTKPPGGCDLVGFERAVELTFRYPVAAAGVHVRSGAAPAIALPVFGPLVAFSDANAGYLAGRDSATGVAVLSETVDGGKTWTNTVLGWGSVVGVGRILGPDVVERPVVAIACPELGNGGATDPACTAGVFRVEGLTRTTLVSRRVPLAMAMRGDAIAVLAQGDVLPTASYPYPAVDLLLSRDGGATWRKAPSPCAPIPLGTSSIAFDVEGQPVIVCEGTRADGGVERRILRAAGATLPTTWTAMSPLPGTESMLLALGPDGLGIAWGRGGTAVGFPAPPYVTTDGGGTWTARPDLANGRTRVVESASVANGTAYVLAFDGDRMAHVLLRTTDGAATWTEIAAYPAERSPGQ